MLNQTIPPAIQRFLDRSLPIFKRDQRIMGVAAGGSFITDTMDEYSDLDLVVAIRPEAYDEIIANVKAFIAQFGNPICLFRGDHVGETRLWICIFGRDMLHVDFKFIKLADFATRVEDPVILWEQDRALSEIMAGTTAHFPSPSRQWLEDRFWCWVYYLAQKLNRGERFECLDGLAFLRNQVLGPILQMRYEQQPRGVRMLETVVDSEMPRLIQTVSGYDSADLKRALYACIDLYREIREPEDGTQLVHCNAMEEATMVYLAGIDP